MFRDWLYSLRDDDELSGETIKKIKSVMAAIFSFAVVEELSRSSPVKGWRLKEVKSGYEPVIVSPEEAMRIVEELESPLQKALVFLVACTGLRASEACGLQWGDVQGSLIHIRRRWSAGTLDEPKTDTSKASVACHPTLFHFLAEWRKMSPYAANTDWIFPSIKMNGKIPL